MKKTKGKSKLKDLSPPAGKSASIKGGVAIKLPNPAPSPYPQKITKLVSTG